MVKPEALPPSSKLKFESISQPSALSMTGTTERTNDERTDVKNDKSKFVKIPDTVTVGQMVEVLNGLGVGARDMMIIFHALRAAGALHAELEAM